MSAQQDLIERSLKRLGYLGRDAGRHSRSQLPAVALWRTPPTRWRPDRALDRRSHQAEARL